MRKFILLLTIAAFFCGAALAQNIGINGDGSAPDSSAILDVKHPHKGMLLPRVALLNTSDDQTVPFAAVSLLVYNTATAGSGSNAVIPGFYYWSGTVWTPLKVAATAPGWSLVGNAGMVNGTNFIGTTDSVPFNIRVNNQKAGRIESNASTGNTFWGYQAGNVNTGIKNTANGYGALQSNSTGTDNTATGSRALEGNSTGYYNTANGSQALFSNTMGSKNTANGSGALYMNYSGSNNTAIGYGADVPPGSNLSNATAIGSRAIVTASNSIQLGDESVNAIYLGNGNAINIKVNNQKAGRIDAQAANTFWGYQAGNVNSTGAYNTANGYTALPTNTTGSRNTASGVSALNNNTAGAYNTADGVSALYSNTTGNYNTASGHQALLSNTTGTNNTAIGYNADVPAGSNLSNATAIGNGAIVNTSNSIQLGNAAVTDIYLGSGNAINIKVNSIKSGRIESNDSTGNTFWGYQAGNVNTGVGNTANGYAALKLNSTGGANTASGREALSNNTTGAGNVANGYHALFANGNGGNNTANGVYALSRNLSGSHNTANGESSLEINTNGSNNTASGGYSLANNLTGSFNTAIGYAADVEATNLSNATAIGSGAVVTASNSIQLGNASVTDISLGKGNAINIKVNSQKAGRIDAQAANTFWGYQAGNINSTGYGNTANGYQALQTNATANYNTATGYQALNLNNTGSNNTADGVSALSFNTTGSYNTAHGVQALYHNTTGNYNSTNGVSALASNTTGSNNTAIGYGADVPAGSNLSNATAIGNGAIVNASNKIRLGNGAVSVIEGQVAYSYPSDKRFKYNIQPNVPGLAFIQKLTPVTYYFDEEALVQFSKTGMLNNNGFHTAAYTGEKQLHTGFVAQDVEKIANELGYKFDGVHAPANDKDHYSLAYSQFIMPLVKAVQEQQQTIEDQKSSIDTLKMQVAELMKAVQALKHP